MPKYIDVKTIPDLFDEKFKETQKLIEAGETQLDNLAEGFAEAEKIVLFKAQTVDVQEVKHGRWAHLGGDEWCCTCCGFVITTEGAWEEPAEKYCSYCGARMDGVTENK